MGRQRTDETADLPPGIIVRKRASGNYYYFQTTSVGARRREYPLGKVRSVAIARWRDIASQAPLPTSRVGMMPWLAKLLYAACKANAKRRGIEFVLTVEDVTMLMVNSEGKCALTGIEFDLFKDPAKRVRLWAPSIDRIECRDGYAVGNVRLVANAVNIALSDFGEEVLTQIARGIVKTRYGKVV